MQKTQKIVLISIKPKYANKILFGVKTFEFRKKPIHPDTSHIVLYMTSPIMKIVGIASVKDIHVGAPTTIWEKTKKSGGVTRKFYRDYFKGKKQAYAIELKDVQPLNYWIDPKQIDKGFRAPQSFKYINHQFFEAISPNREIKQQPSHIIFFGGVHGVGKSTFCKKLKEDIGIQTYTASQLIKTAKNSNTTTDKRVNNIEDNQSLLLKSLQDKSKDGNFILDGHFCLINVSGEIETIPIDTFYKINPRVLFLLELDATKIYENLKRRDHVHYDLNFIQEMLRTERKHAEEISIKLQIPLEIITISDYSQVRDYILIMTSSS